ncbi:MAG TPA: hypothetical protein VJ942_05605 [Roseovarius sp.]|nr:hypothetical protein [Roseovarius sp.]
MLQETSPAALGRVAKYGRGPGPCAKTAVHRMNCRALGGVQKHAECYKAMRFRKSEQHWCICAGWDETVQHIEFNI